MTNVEMTVGDLEPDLMLQLRSKGKPLPTADVVSCQVIGIKDGVVLFTNAATVNATGEVTMTWNASDTDEVGTIEFKVRLVWPDSRPQTVDVDDVVKVYPVV